MTSGLLLPQPLHGAHFHEDFGLLDRHALFLRSYLAASCEAAKYFIPSEDSR